MASPDGNGYLHGTIFDVKHFAHRLVWAMQTGEWPSGDIDHINGNRHENRWANLRSVTRQENRKNAAIPSNNKSGVLGVFWSKRDSVWIARIGDNRTGIHLGNFHSFDDAVAVRKTAEAEYNFHPNHGRAA